VGEKLQKGRVNKGVEMGKNRTPLRLKEAHIGFFSPYMGRFKKRPKLKLGPPKGNQSPPKIRPAKTFWGPPEKVRQKSGNGRINWS